MPFTREEFDQQHRPRFGTANPDRMRVPFWDWMIRGDDSPGRVEDDEERESSGYDPYKARKILDFGPASATAPIWTLSRIGASRTELPDGRIVRVGGEHEDWYDPDFWIYNDVVVFRPDGEFEIYGYPRQVFSPTDFHTATRVGDRLILIGRLGDAAERRPGPTPVFALDLTDYSIAAIPVAGTSPGWIWKHQATLNDEGLIVVEGGETMDPGGGVGLARQNFESYSFDPSTGHWQRLTNRNWRQLIIHREHQAYFEGKTEPPCRQLYPSSFAFTSRSCDDWTQVRFFTRGVMVHVLKRLQGIVITIEGDLPTELGEAIADEIRANVEAAIGQPCFVG